MKKIASAFRSGAASSGSASVSLARPGGCPAADGSIVVAPSHRAH